MATIPSAVARSRCIAAQQHGLEDVHRFFVGSYCVNQSLENEVSSFIPYPINPLFTCPTPLTFALAPPPPPLSFSLSRVFLADSAD